MSNQPTAKVEKDHDLHVRQYRLSTIFREVESWSKDDRNDPKKVEATAQQMKNLGMKGCPHTKIEMMIALG